MAWDFTPTEEQGMLVDSVRQFMEKEIFPHEREIERRGEIGLRRALGATRPHISRQFLVEAVILSGLGGLAGVGRGIGLTATYARVQGWQTVVPANSSVLGLAAAVAIGAIAGLFPAIRAARLAPADALRHG